MNLLYSILQLCWLS